jgi:trigger factor
MVPMKTEFTEVNETRKNLSFEIPSDVVDAEIDRVAKQYSRTARVPGFRPGKVPAHVIRVRFKDQILSDVAHDLIPRVVTSALQERGLEPVAAPDIRDLVLDEGQPLTFVADFETLPPIDPGEYTGLTARKPPAVLEVGAVDRALDRLRERAARWHSIEDRPAEGGDTALLDLTRTVQPRLIQLAGEAPPPQTGDAGKPEALQNVTVEIGAPANPPGFDEHLTGMSIGDGKAFTVRYPSDFEAAELAGATVDYDVKVKAIRRKELLPLDDEFAKEVSDAETLTALRERIHDNLQHEAEHDADHRVRHALLQQLSSRLKSAPQALVDQEVDRRLEELVHRLMEQGVDPMKANVDWQQFREAQRQPAEETVKSTLVLDEIGRREQIEASDEDLTKEIERFAERSGRTPTAVRATLDKEGGLDRIRAGIRRERTMSWLLERANIVTG